MKTFASLYQPRDEERDRMGNFHSTHFHVVFGTLRYKFLKYLDIGQEWFEALGLTLVAKSQSFEFFAPVRNAEGANFVLSLAKIGNSSITFQCDVTRDGDGILVAKGSAVTIVVSRDSGKPVSIPAEARGRLAPYLGTEPRV